MSKYLWQWYITAGMLGAFYGIKSEQETWAVVMAIMLSACAVCAAIMYSKKDHND